MHSAVFASFARQHRPAVNTRLQAVLAQSTPANNQTSRQLQANLAKFVGRGGKRLRPLLVLLAYEGYGGQRRPAAIDVAVSQELLHTFLLIHDDSIDQDFKRWGGYNIMGTYFESHSQSLDARQALHAAESYALLAGDLCHSLAQTCLTDADFPDPIIKQLASLQQQTVLEVINGQLQDIDASYDPAMPTEQAILAMYRAKTASYSFRLPLLAGAIAAQADPAEYSKITTLADDIGIAYQLQDDMLGIFGDSAATGKPLLSDLRAAKQTVLLTTALRLSSKQQAQQLRSYIGTTNLDETDCSRIRAIMIDCDAQQYVQTLIQTYTDRAAAGITRTNLSMTAQAQLHDITARLIDRQA